MASRTETRQGGIRLFTIFGIEIRLDPSVLIIFGLIVYSLGSGVFVDWHPDWPTAITWLTALTAGICFFISLLAHELSHSLVAQRFGIRVPRITLFLFGGVAEIESEAETPGSELAIAIAGPLMSLAIAFGCTMAAATLVGAEALADFTAAPESAMGRVNPLATVFIWLGSVNYMLAIFNMVPGFPLDGGRVFRAIVWYLKKDRMLATRWAAEIGKMFGWLLIAMGCFNLLVAHAPGGLWLILIGWFLSHLATMSYGQAFTVDRLAHYRVADLMRTHFESAPAQHPVDAFVEEHLLRSNQQLWPVLDQGRAVGTVSLEEIVALTPEQRARSTLADVMIPIDPASALTADMQAVDANQRLTLAGDTPLVVLRGQQVVGLLKATDVLRWMTLHRSQDT